MIKRILLVGCGGFVGSAARYLISIGIARVHTHGFPLATLLVNLLGGFLIGLFSEGLGQTHKNAALLLTTGLCGGFTTFSTFGLETVKLFEGGHQGLAALNIVLSVSLCLTGVLLGRATASAFRPT